mmetsp:Transcript_10468/g.22469  ORF Transcript_10468/g.22469 Transcript_10468/m.22469 type:complete len:210 (-) Transcript_10468:144-773(-)
MMDTARWRRLSSSTTVSWEKEKTSLARCLSIPVWGPIRFTLSSSVIQCSTQKSLLLARALYSLCVAMMRSQCSSRASSISLLYSLVLRNWLGSVFASGGRCSATKSSSSLATLSLTSVSTFGVMNLPIAMRTMISMNSNLHSALSSLLSASVVPLSSSKLVEMNMVSRSAGRIPGVLGSTMLQSRAKRWNSRSRITSMEEESAEPDTAA